MFDQLLCHLLDLQSNADGNSFQDVSIIIGQKNDHKHQRTKQATRESVDFSRLDTSNIQ